MAQNANGEAPTSRQSKALLVGARCALHPSAVVENVIVKAGRVGSALPLAARRDPGELLPGAEVEEQRSSGIAVAGVRVAAGLPEGRDEVPTHICPVRKRRR